MAFVFGLGVFSYAQYVVDGALACVCERAGGRLA